MPVRQPETTEKDAWHDRRNPLIQLRISRIRLTLQVPIPLSHARGHRFAIGHSGASAPITRADIAALQRILVAAGIGDDETFAAASERAGSFGLFIRSIVGLDRAAAKAAFNDFLDEKRYSKNQIEFVNLIIDSLTEHGVVEPGRVYDSPFTAVAPEGPEGLFGSADVIERPAPLTI